MHAPSIYASYTDFTKFLHPLQPQLPESVQKRPMVLSQEKGASCWFTTLPISQFTLHKGAFCDIIALRYGWDPYHAHSHCIYGK